MLEKFTSEHPGLWEFIKFTLLGAIASVTEMACYALLNYWLLVPYANVDFHWWLYDYSTANGGLKTFLSLTCSYGLGQIVNFFVQRKLTFKADNNQAASAVMFAISVVAIYLFITWLPTLFIQPLYAAVGESIGAILAKLICMTSGFLIQFPLNKYIIMAKKKQPK